MMFEKGRRELSRRPFVFFPSRKTVREDEDGATETSRQGDLSRPHSEHHHAKRCATDHLCVDDRMIYRPRQDATAINLRMGSGDRLTSRRCHEITWPFCLEASA
ncbi:hypothetical protein EFB14_30490 [Rhizobium fabae]|uniref:Uncharacterized protein n=1 Tax=Rhizobium fabae TaxID=573179 RepID=A0ABY0B0Q7_9HYPH|nr:hypothetical protein EFB14_30490 [Rhizobium fabae]